jgi:hypothetical protein
MAKKHAPAETRAIGMLSSLPSYGSVSSFFHLAVPEPAIRR